MTKKENAALLVEKRAELKEVKTAISKILTAQSYKIGSRSVTRVDLSELLKLKKELQDEITALSGSGGRIKRVIPLG